MPHRCTVCDHKDLEEINRALLAGETLRNIAKRYPFSFTALYRHKEKHLPLGLLKAKEVEAVTNADRLLAEVESLRLRATSILAQAEADRNWTAALGGIREARNCLELLARLLGELKQQGPTVNVLVMPEWVSLRGKIFAALAPYPEARLALAAALEEPHAGT